MTRADAAAVLPHLPEVPLVVLSSMDVYRAYELALSGRAGIPVPLGEDSPLREGRYPHRGFDPGLEGYDLDIDRYDKLDVEPLYLQRGAIVLRLGMVYGEGDVQRREEFILRRVRAGRRRIPIGEGAWRWTGSTSATSPRRCWPPWTHRKRWGRCSTSASPSPRRCASGSARSRRGRPRRGTGHCFR